jgi:hypothetical protein
MSSKNLVESIFDRVLEDKERTILNKTVENVINNEENTVEEEEVCLANKTNDSSDSEHVDNLSEKTVNPIADAEKKIEEFEVLIEDKKTVEVKPSSMSVLCKYLTLCRK